MVHKVFSIRDAKAEFFNSPFLQKTEGEAERTFTSLVNDNQSTLSKHPEDYDLYFVGEYDDNTGKYDLQEAPVHRIKAVNCIAKIN